MIELPEAIVLAGQINGTLKGKRILGAAFGHTPHKLAWYYGNKEYYRALLDQNIVGTAAGFGSLGAGTLFATGGYAAVSTAGLVLTLALIGLIVWLNRPQLEAKPV